MLSHIRKSPVGDEAFKKIGSGDRIRTCDLRVMSPTSYLAAPPRTREAHSTDLPTALQRILCKSFYFNDLPLPSAASSRKNNGTCSRFLPGSDPLGGRCLCSIGNRTSLVGKLIAVDRGTRCDQLAYLGELARPIDSVRRSDDAGLQIENDK